MQGKEQKEMQNQEDFGSIIGQKQTTYVVYGSFDSGLSCKYFIII